MFACCDEAKGVAAHRQASASARNGVDGWERGSCGRDRARAGKIKRGTAFAGGQPTDLASSKQQIKRHANVGHEHDAQQPSEGVAGLAFFTDESSNGEDGQQKTAHCQKVGKNVGADGFGDFGSHGWRPTVTMDWLTR